MEVAKIQGTGIRIKSKLATFVVNPLEAKGKLTADALLLFEKFPSKATFNLEGETVFIEGPGEYEIKGVKLNGQNKGGSVIYTGKIDGIDVTILKASAGQKGKDNIQDCNIAIIDADVVAEQSLISALNANVVILYGQQALETAKLIGKEPVKTAKYSVTRDKLPSDMELMLLE